MSDEEWVKAAMADDSVVVELLIRLNQAPSPPPPKRLSPVLPLDWSVRQRRSKPMQKPTARASPTTPLSWSGGTSVSGGAGGSAAATAADGFEESSRPLSRRATSDSARSKLNVTSEATATKRSRKKKTLTELKEEENLLVKERRHLKRELASLRASLDKQRANNESLKRLKLDLQLRPVVAESVPTGASHQPTLDRTEQNIAACDPNSSVLPQGVKGNHLDASPKVSSPLQFSETQVIVEQENKFVLPDLNMPLEDDIGSEALCGIS